MKKLITVLLVIVLGSCGSSLEPPKSNTDYKNIIGKPFKIGNIEVTEKDFPKTMNWEDAKKACESLGNGWRLPNKNELNTLYQNKDKIGGFTNDLYWSGTKEEYATPWGQNFGNGTMYYFNEKSYSLYVRAIRTF